MTVLLQTLAILEKHTRLENCSEIFSPSLLNTIIEKCLYSCIKFHSLGRVRAKLSAPLAGMPNAKTDSRGRSRTKMVSQSQRTYCLSALLCS